MDDDDYEKNAIKLLISDLITIIERTKASKTNYAELRKKLSEIDNLFTDEYRSLNALGDDDFIAKHFYTSSLFKGGKCDACSGRNSLFWRRVARNKIVCNTCFFDKTYLLAFEDKTEDGSANSDAKKVSNGSSTQTQSEIRVIPTRTLVNSIKNSSNSKGIVDDNVLMVQVPEVNSKVKLPQEVSEDKAKATVTEVSEKSDAAGPLVRKSTRACCVNKKKEVSSPVNTVPTSLNLVSVKREASEFVDLGIVGQDVIGGQRSAVKEEIVSTNRRTKKFKMESEPVKIQSLVSRVNTSDYVFHRGFYMQVGDVVALFDQVDKDTVYFAKIRAFLVDQFGQKSAVITWLIPTQQRNSIRLARDFDPKCFTLGPSEEFPRPLDCMEFVCRLSEHTNHFRAFDDHYFDPKSQYTNDLFRHRQMLRDIDDSRFRILTSKNSQNDNNEDANHQISVA